MSHGRIFDWRLPYGAKPLRQLARLVVCIEGVAIDSSSSCEMLRSVWSVEYFVMAEVQRDDTFCFNARHSYAGAPLKPVQYLSAELTVDLRDKMAIFSMLAGPLKNKKSVLRCGVVRLTRLHFSR
jgi:hypothetical protein